MTVSTSSNSRFSVWDNNKCKICQVNCSTEEQKLIHLRIPLHVKRTNIHDFLEKIASKKTTQQHPSTIAKRYEQCGEHVIGSECIIELVFPWASSGWWACSICYESGSNFDQLDAHLNSRRHLGIYINELAEEPNINAMTCDVNKLLELKEEIFRKDERMLPPDVVSLTLSREQACIALVLTEKDPPYTEHESGHEGVIILSCQLCHESFLCRKDISESFVPRVWAVHSMSPCHRAALAIQNIIQLCNPSEVLDESSGTEDGPYYWKNYELLLDGKQPPPGTQMQGPVVGIRHLVVFGRQSFCSLCFCMVDSLEEHFSAESHILKFVNKYKPHAGFVLTHCSPHTRRTKLLAHLESRGLGNDRSMECVSVSSVPSQIACRAHAGTLPTPNPVPPFEHFDITKKCIGCPICGTVMPVESGSEAVILWEKHISSKEHFLFSAKRNEFSFDNDFFVSVDSSLEKELENKNTRGSWTEEEDTYVQDQANVGVEYVVEDLEIDEFVCTLCAERFPRSSKEGIIRHVRSLNHLKLYLHVNNRELLSVILSKDDTKTVLDLSMEWLQRAPLSVSQADDIRVYNASVARKMATWGRVPVRTIASSEYDERHRAIFETMYAVVDQISNDGVEKEEVSIREALLATSTKVLDMCDKDGHTELVCRCTKCKVVFVTREDRIADDSWNGHFKTDEHFRRQTAFKSCLMVPHGFAEGSSNYTVKEFVQKDPAKKVTWQWNAAEKLHEFVLAVVGLQDIVERRSVEGMGSAQQSDFFCRLCAIAFPRRAFVLEEHMRSATHVYCYVHKYHPLAVKKIESLSKTDGGREIRKELAQLLKNVKPPAEYCMSVYDPVGERERRGLVALQKAKEAERQRQIEEQRKIAEEARKRRDEERRKQREKELEKEQKQAADRGRVEKEARERKARIEARLNDERERLKAAALAKKQELAAAKAKVEDERRRLENERLVREKAALQAKLEEDKKKLAAIREKKRQMQLLEEQKKLEKELEEVRQRKALEQQRLGVPQPGLVIPPTPGLSYAPHIRGVPPVTADIAVTGYSAPTISARLSVTSAPRTFGAASPTVTAAMPSAMGMPPTNQSSGTPSIWNPCGRPSLLNTQVDPYILDSTIIHSREQLVDFIWRQGTKPIPEDELPRRFNNYATATEGLVGLESVYEVVCIDDPKLDTFYCSMCNFWSLPADMFKHMETSGHRLAFLFKYRKAFHRAVMSETNVTVRNAMVEQFAIQIWQREKPLPEVSQRLRTVLNREAIERLWPDVKLVLDHSWRRDPRAGSPLAASPPPMVERSQEKSEDVEGIPIDDDDIVCIDGSRKETSKASQEKRSRSRSKDTGKENKEKEKANDKERSRKASRRSPSPKRRRTSRSRSKDKKDRDRERRKKRSRSRERKRSRSRERRRSSKERKRSRSRSKDRKRSRSRSKERKREKKDGDKKVEKMGLLADVVPGKALSWEETAAAFLAKIGDIKGASKVLDDSRIRPALGTDSGRKRTDSSASDVAATTLPLPEAAKMSVASATPEYHHSQDAAPPGVEPPATASKKPEEPVDQNQQMRKMLGLIVTMQQEAEQRGGLDETVINKLYSEMGLTRNDGSEGDALMSRLCGLIGGGGSSSEQKPKPAIDLAMFGITDMPKQGLLSSSTPVFTPSNAYNSPTAGYMSNYPGGPSSSAAQATFGQNSQNVYGVRRETPQKSLAESPCRRNTPPSSSPANSAELPSHLKNLLSGLKGTLDMITKKREASPPLPRSNLVINRADDVFRDSEEVSYVYPTKDEYDERDSYPSRKVREEEDLWDYGGADMYSHERERAMRGPPPSSSAQPAPSRPAVRQLPVPAHPSESRRLQDQSGYDPVLPTMARTDGMGQSYAGGLHARNQGRGWPRPRDVRDQPIQKAAPPSQPTQSIPSAAPPGVPMANKPQRKRMRRELREKGYNPDSFTYPAAGPVPIPGRGLHLPKDYVPSGEDLEDHEGGQSQLSPQEPRTFPNRRPAQQPSESSGGRHPVQQQLVAGNKAPPKPQNDIPVIDLEDEDWEGAMSNLDSILRAEKERLEGAPAVAQQAVHEKPPPPTLPAAQQPPPPPDNRTSGPTRGPPAPKAAVPMHPPQVPRGIGPPPHQAMGMPSMGAGPPQFGDGMYQQMYAGQEQGGYGQGGHGMHNGNMYGGVPGPEAYGLYGQGMQGYPQPPFDPNYGGGYDPNYGPSYYGGGHGYY